MRNMLSIRWWSTRRSAVAAQTSIVPSVTAKPRMPAPASGAKLPRRPCLGVRTAALLAGAALGGWAVPTMPPSSAAMVGHQVAFDPTRDTRMGDELKQTLVGSYLVSGTEPDGRPYAGAGVVDISLAPSGALELEWDNGRQLGVAQVIGDSLVVACLTKGRTAILIMTINADGSLSGRWSRRTDRGQKGTEMWKRA